MITVTTNYVPGYRITKVIGTTWGITVRSRGLGGNIMAGLRSIAGGKIKEYVELLDQSRREALEELEKEVIKSGANAVINLEFDIADISQYMTEITAYGTAVVVEPEDVERQPVRLG